MSDENYKKILSKNLNHYLKIKNKSQKEVADFLGISTTTFNNWCLGISLPRMGKIQMLADYFHIEKSDLLEDKPEPTYYINEETKQIAQEVYDNPDLKILFDATKNCSPEDMRLVIEMAKRLKGDN